MRDVIHNGLFTVAGIMFLVGALLGLAWGGTALFNNSILETEAQARMCWRVLAVLMCGSTGIFHLLGYWGHKEKRREWLKDNGG
jgi:hypothetical protein